MRSRRTKGWTSSPLSKPKSSVESTMRLKLGILGCCLLCLCACTSPERTLQPAAKQRQPNIVFILADDLGWSDLGVYGNQFFETPHLDRLSRQGMRFTDAYASASQCAPTRACLLTGRDIGRHGIWAVSRLRGLEEFRKMIPPENETRLPLGEITIAEVLREVGYRTAMFGKWHLGTDEAYLPSNRGFHEALTFPEAYRYFGSTTRPPVDVKPGTYLTDFLTDQAVRFIEENSHHPFFLYLPHFAVHGPLRARDDFIPRYRQKKVAGSRGDPVYAAMIQSLDESVGRIMAKLDEVRLDENTVVIFYSDNGGAGGYERDGIEWFSPTTNEPLRGGKGMLYEGGIRVPLIVRWPGVIEPASVSHEPVTSTDLFPTFLDIAGRKVDLSHPLDGISFLPLLQKAKESWNRGPLYWHYPSYLQADVEKGTWRITPSGAIRSGDYKLIEFFEDDRRELYDLRRDLGETQDLAQVMPDKARELLQQLIDWRAATNAPMPVMKSR